MLRKPRVRLFYSVKLQEQEKCKCLILFNHYFHSSSVSDNSKNSDHCSMKPEFVLIITTHTKRPERHKKTRQMTTSRMKYKMTTKWQRNPTKMKNYTKKLKTTTCGCVLIVFVVSENVGEPGNTHIPKTTEHCGGYKGPTTNVWPRLPKGLNWLWIDKKWSRGFGGPWGS